MAKSPTTEEILNDAEACKISGFKMTKLFYAETPEAVDAYIEAGVDINHTDISKETALDFCINRIVRGINKYEDSDNKGAVLQMIRHGGNCSEESLEALKEKDPQFYTRVMNMFEAREMLEAARENSSLKIGELRDRLGEKTIGLGTTYMPRDHRSMDPDYNPGKERWLNEMMKRHQEKKAKTTSPLEEVNRPKNLTLVKTSGHKPLHEFDSPIPPHETTHSKNARQEVLPKKGLKRPTISHKEAIELGIKPRLKIKRSIEGPNYEPTLKITEIYDEKEIAQKRNEFKRKELLNQAEYISNEGYLDIDDLCKKMVNAAKVGPVKSADGGYMFVVDKGATLEETLFAWKEQTYRPWLEERHQKGVPVDRMLNFLDMHDQNTNIDTTASSYIQAAMVEQIVEHHPEHVGKISMLQLLNAYEKCGKQNADVIGKALQDKAREYIYTFDKETFPPTLENMVTLNTNRDKLASALATGNVSTFNLVHRIAYTELKMLKSLKSEDLEFVSDKTISEGLKIADKHKDAGNFSKIFTDEIAKREIEAKNKTFDPRDL